MCRVCQNDHVGDRCPVMTFRGNRILCLVSAEIEKEKEPLIQLSSDAQIKRKFVGVLKRLSFADIRILRDNPGLNVDEFRTGRNTGQDVELNERRDYEKILSELFFAKDLREFHSPEFIARLESDPLWTHPFVSDQFMIGLQAAAPVRPPPVQATPLAIVQAAPPAIVQLAVRFVVQREMEAKVGNECPVCLEELDNSTVCTLMCNHQYCSKCFSSMVQHRISRCGLCRAVYKSAFVPNETIREEVIGFAVGVARTLLIS
jgi:hypothetical protein